MNKIKLLIFDLDGVLVDSRPLHYHALNMALREIDEKYIIDQQAHLARYDGNPTSVKLKMLTEEKGLPVEKHQIVWKLKQEKTQELIDQFPYDERIRSILKKLKDDGYKIMCASNSIWETVKNMLLRKGFLEYMDWIVSNEDVVKPKPNPEIYLKCITRLGLSPRETLIMEDSDIGRKAALLSGAFLCPIIDPQDLTWEKITRYIQMAEQNNENNSLDVSGQLRDLQVVIPMAGHGSRFANAGYTFPKPLIEVRGKPMIQVVCENLNVKAKFIFIVQKAHLEKYNLKHFLNAIAPGCQIVLTDGVTEGAACSVLLAKEFIDNDKPLILANSDQFTEWSSSRFLYSMLSDQVDGGILTFESTHPKWSYAKTDENGWVTEVAEKKPISNLATVGIYYYKKGSDFVKYAEQMISKNIRVNNEFYVCPVFNEFVLDGKKIKTFNAEKMWGIGTPEDLDYFLANYKGDV